MRSANVFSCLFYSFPETYVYNNSFSQCFSGLFYVLFFKEKVIVFFEYSLYLLSVIFQNQPTIDSPKLITPQVNGSVTGKAIAPASLWTRPKLQEFINHVKRDASSVLVVGRGETVTIRVPTHEHGNINCYLNSTGGL